MPFDGNTLSTATAGTFTAGVFTDTFSIAGADVNMVRFTFQAGHQYVIDEDNLASGDLCLRIFDARGHEVRFNDDGSFSNDDVVLATSPYAVFRPNYTGVYYVALSASFLRNYDPTTTAGRISPENPPASFSGDLNVTDLGSAPEWPGANGIGASGLTAEGANDETDVLRGDDRAGRRVEYTGTFEFAADVDIGRVDLRKGDMVVVDVTGLAGNGTVLRVFNAAGTQIGFDSASGTASDAELNFVAPTTGTYYIGVSGTGNTAYNVIDGTGAVAGEAGDYSIVFHLNPTQVGTGSSNFFTGSSGEDYIVSLSANDTIQAGAGNDTLAGGDDDDSLSGEDGEDDLYGEHGNDTMFGGRGADVLVGGIGNDLLDGGTEDDILDGGAGNDILNGRTGADVLTGGTGDNSYYTDNVNDTTTEGAGAGIDTVRSTVDWTLTADFERLFLLGTAVNGTGNALSNFIYGNASANVLDGQGNADRLTGQGGNDTYIVDSTGDLIFETIAGAAGGLADIVVSSVNHTLSNNVENLALTGAVNINGTGNTLANSIVGSAFNNFIDGKAGNDVLSGVAGNDQFLFTTALDAATNVDTITDFDPANDFLRLDDAIFTQIAAGFLAGTAFVTGTAATNAAHRIVYDSATGDVFYDSDGLGGVAQLKFAILSGLPALTESDIFVF